ncbi:MAG TPA: adenylate/guanylate cyclase domain-containing protein, partial [Gemmatimonadaceae bacterium]|nr:adenylate/guanylate cyclase domain-containing protein [Gemmatimonadaceae bacterium]
RVRPRVERILFRERFALDEAMKHLPEKLAAARGPEGLWSMTGTELMTNLRPSSCVIFAAAESAFVPVFVEGTAAPAAIPAEGELVPLVATFDSAKQVDRQTRQKAGPMGAAVLASLDAHLLLPIRRTGKLEAFISLGEKKSGDVYTSTDLTLLTALATSLSIHLLRFDEAELLERTRAIQEKMRRYVPGALAEAIAHGTDLETGEREVSLLFVDIRGYTAYSDGRNVTDIFSTVNKYTETVSSVVTELGGAVVEFNGDGMMAVFGAPRHLDQKERAAVLAAKRLAETVPQMNSDTTLSVGVGVATGQAFVGNIEAVDRTIWSAIGSTTNLAARLQTLTRDMKVSVLIDSATHRAAGDAATGFSRHDGTQIRGRRELETVYSL